MRILKGGNRKTRYKHRKGLTVAVIVFFIVISVVPLTGRLVFDSDDTTPPVTTHTLDPPEPNGENGWYASNFTVILNATDEMSGVKEIRYRVVGGNWQTIPKDYGSFIVDVDGDDLLIEYYAIDNVGNEESINIFTTDIDQKPPEVLFEWDIFEEGGIIYIKFSIKSFDATSGMDRVEMYINEGLHEVNTQPDEAYYEFVIQWSDIFKTCTFMFVSCDSAGKKIIVKLESIKAFLFGRIENLTIVGNIFIFNAVRIRVIQFSPFSFNTYTSGEKIALFEPRLKIVTNRFMFGSFTMLFDKITYSYS